MHIETKDIVLLCLLAVSVFICAIVFRFGHKFRREAKQERILNLRRPGTLLVATIAAIIFILGTLLTFESSLN